MNAPEFSIDEYPLGERIRYHRKRRRITQAELAKRSHVSQGAISQIEKSQMLPSLVTIYEIARVLEIHVARLFAGEDVPVFELKDLRKRYRTWGALTPPMRRSFKKVEAYLASLG
jgi:transcriptional regulator with XRE-family HTH domain